MSTSIHIPPEQFEVAQKLCAQLIAQGVSFTLVHNDYGTIEIHILKTNDINATKD